jgi:hypothetical protein
MIHSYLSRKFLLTASITAAGIVGFLLGKMSGGEFVAFAPLVIGAYGASNVAAKRFQTED